MELFGNFIKSIYDYLHHCTLHLFGSYDITLWSILCVSVIFSIVGAFIGGLLKK